MGRVIKVSEGKKVEKKNRDKTAKYFADFVEAWADDREIPKEVLDYVASRLLDATIVATNSTKEERNNRIVRALGLSGRGDPGIKSCKMGAELVKLEYKHRHHKNPEKAAIKEFCEETNYKESTIKKYYSEGVIWPYLGAIFVCDDIESEREGLLPHNHKQILQYFKNKIRKEEREK